MYESNYFNKIAILFIATFANIFVIWYFMIREESSNWISSQVVHQISPYIIDEDSDGLVIDNVILDYEFRLPPGFKTIGARNFSFFMEEDGQKKCEIRHYYINASRAKKLSSDDGKTVILLNSAKLVFELVGTKEEKNFCAKYLEQIEASLITD
ncbi:MAG: hypothetical protein UU95_C0016G0033 [Parcubacteria group bacterium GW2011_GWC2_42_12]|nr:MAG: hypothetical protein UU95_C0016G0033 [Parcubacteria group bacterium GW2011_GWC2_42_12]